MGHTPISCRDCGDATTRRSRCAACQVAFDHERNSQLKRRAYADPAYRSIAVLGQPCYWGCGRLATTRDHIVPLAHGGVNDPMNIVPACRTCNSARGGAL